MRSVYEIYGNTSSFLSKLDGILELNFLHINRDQENGIGETATGGNCLYLSPGLRFSFPSLQNANLGVLVKLPIWKNLNAIIRCQAILGRYAMRIWAWKGFGCDCIKAIPKLRK